MKIPTMIFPNFSQGVIKIRVIFFWYVEFKSKNLSSPIIPQEINGSTIAYNLWTIIHNSVNDFLEPLPKEILNGVVDEFSFLFDPGSEKLSPILILIHELPAKVNVSSLVVRVERNDGQPFLTKFSATLLPSKSNKFFLEHIPTPNEISHEFFYVVYETSRQIVNTNTVHHHAIDDRFDQHEPTNHREQVSLLGS